MYRFGYDLPLDQLQTYTIPRNPPDDLDAFWQGVLERSAGQPLNSASEPVAYPVPGVRVERISYDAYDGGRIAGWFIAPADGGPAPCLVHYHGYSGKRGPVADYLMWALQGIACLAVDVRGQGGESTDGATYPGGRGYGWMTAGLLDPHQFYFTRAFADAVRALDYAVSRADAVRHDALGVTGVSQGGGLSLGVCALDHRPVLCMAEIPAFGHVGRTLELTRAMPWAHLMAYLRLHPEHSAIAERTFSYCELNNLAERITCPTLVSAGLVDELVPPSTIFTVYNRLGSEAKRIDAYPFAGHEARLNIDTMVEWARRHLLAA
jgi:cephalosporin-C deacetylase